MSRKEMAVQHPNVKLMDEIEKAAAQQRIAISSPQKLREWLEESGRRWLVFDALELVNALPWPDGVEALMWMIARYGDYRATIPSTTGESVEQPDPYAAPGALRLINVPKCKPETLELAELDRCIRYLISVASQLDGRWSLETAPR